MIPSNDLELALLVSLALALVFFAGLLVLFRHSYRDPRWRVFDFNSRQVSEGDVYNVAEIPAIRSVRLVGPRRLRIGFTPPIHAPSWEITTADGVHSVSRGRHPEIRFPDTTVDGTYRLVPEGVTLHRDIVIRIAFDPKENHEVSGLSWPDNYFSPFCSVPFSRTRPSSVREWAGLPESDPDVVAARRILGDAVDPDAPTLARVEQVFRFVMARIHASGGTPSDAVQDASPMETYALLSGGGGKGWCENRALVFYLFANAACIATRLVDIAGKFGPLKLTGHYFCESWIPEHTAWCFVDPQSAIACITARDGRPLHTLDIKRRIGLDALEGCMARTYDASTGSVVDRDLAGFQHGFAGYFQREIVLAYKFGYSKNRTYSRLKHFLFYPTHLVATFALPNRYRVKWVFLGGFATTMAASLLLALGVLIR